MYFDIQWTVSTGAMQIGSYTCTSAKDRFCYDEGYISALSSAGLLIAENKVRFTSQG